MHIRRVCVVGLFLTLAGCLPRPPLRGVGAADPSDLKNITLHSEAHSRVRRTSVEPHPEFRLAFIELTEAGLALPEQLDDAIESIRQSGEKSLVLLFVHGWGHSADPVDEHVIAFRDALSGLRAMLPVDRSVVGIYIGWPAERFSKPLHYLTFWGRDRAANHISMKADEIGVLEKLQYTVEELRSAGRDVVSVAVGHSLGGKFLFTPMQEKLERLYECLPTDALAVEKIPVHEIPAFGDLILLLNPAQDINDYKVFEDYSSEYFTHYPNHNRSVIVILSSEADSTVRSIFRIGRTLKTLTYTSRWGRGFRAETVGLGWGKQSQLTHTLCLAGDEARRGRICDALRWDKPPVVTAYGDTELRRYGQGGPFMLTRVDGRIVKSHGDLFNPIFLSFLREFVAERVRIPNAVETTAARVSTNESIK